MSNIHGKKTTIFYWQVGKIMYRRGLECCMEINRWIRELQHRNITKSNNTNHKFHKLETKESYATTPSKMHLISMKNVKQH